MRLFCSVLFSSLVFCLVFGIPGRAGAAGADAGAGTPNTALTPVSTLLKHDGSLDLSSGFSGSVDMKGYRMISGANGAPRFVPAGQPQSEAPKQQPGILGGPESDTNDVYWDDQFSEAGVSSSVFAAVVDGSGNLYIGGDFTAVGSLPTNRIAKWNGTSWSALGTGMNGAVYDLAVSGSNVYAGGYFTTAGGTSANRIAVWNGTSWSALGSGMNSIVDALAVSGNALLAGGMFGTAGGKVSSYYAQWQPRVNVTTESVSASPGTMTIGNDVYGFYKPALMTGAGTTVSYPGGLPTDVSLDRADEIEVYGKRVNGAFTLSPEGMQFGGDGATIRVEFSEDDVALFGGSYTDFRAVQLTYPAGYPTNKEAATRTLLAGQSAPAPIRIDNGKQIYAITAPLTGISSTYGAVPSAWNAVTLNWMDLE